MTSPTAISCSRPGRRISICISSNRAASKSRIRSTAIGSLSIHEPGQFSGDIDLLTGRPVIVTAVARARRAVLCVPRDQCAGLLNRVPSFGEKLIVAFTRRRELLSEMGHARIARRRAGPLPRYEHGPRVSLQELRPLHLVRPGKREGPAASSRRWARRERRRRSNAATGRFCVNPSLHELASEAGIWRHCPSQDVDFAIVGAGPAGIAAAVYAASEGLSTLMLDRLGPGGQAGGSSRIENFIGFPAGLSGAELATRGVLQMLKFGARIVAPVEVEKLIPAKSPDDPHVLHLDCGAEIRCRVVLLALGVRWRRLEAAGADRFAGAGIYYACTTVEADLYDGSDVAVVGGGNSAGQAAMFLAECCPTRTVHLLIRRTLGPGMSEYLAQRDPRGRQRASSTSKPRSTRSAATVAWRRSCCKNNATATRQADCPARPCSCSSAPSRRREWLPRRTCPRCQWLSADRNRRRPLGAMARGRIAIPVRWRRRSPACWRPATSARGSTKRVGFAVGDGSLAVTCVHRLLSITR